MADDLKALAQASVVLGVDVLGRMIAYGKNPLGIVVVLTASINFQLYTQIQVILTVKEGLRLVVVGLDSHVPALAKARPTIIAVIAVVIISRYVIICPPSAVDREAA